MPYLIDRTRALYGREIVAVLRARERGVRSRVVLRDNSLYRTATRPKTLRRTARHGLRGTRAGAGGGRRRWS
jgi:hypothetical protein